MAERKQKQVLTIYRIIFSVATICLGIVMLVQLWGIYNSQPAHAFSRASVGAALKEILPVILLWFACLILNIVLSNVYPQEKTKLKGKVDVSVTLATLKKRFISGGKGVAGVKKLRILRYAVAAASGIAIAVCLGWGVSYLFDKNYEVKHTLAFFTETNGVADRALAMLPWLLGAAMLSVVMALMEEYFQKRELALLQAALVDELRRKKAGEEIENPVLVAKGEVEEPSKWKGYLQCLQSPKLLWIVRGVLCISAVVLIILGINWGGMSLVFEKARSICQQCIGLG